MSGKKRRSFTKEFKTTVALAAIREIAPISALASKYEVHPNQIAQWKREAIAHMPEGFERGGKRDQVSEENERELYEQIGRLKMEVAFLEKKLKRIN
jgi:transposase-like protein